MKIFSAFGVHLHASTVCLAFQSSNIWTTKQIKKVEPSTAFVNFVSFSNGDSCGLGKSQRFLASLQMSNNAGDDDDDDDTDEYIEDVDLGDWRSFRKTLVDSGISYDTTKDGYLDKDAEKSETSTISNTGSSIERPKSVSKANEELLEKQSEILAKEYKEGVWAHEAAFAEVGGLVVRMPLEAEIYRNKDQLIIGKELSARLPTDEQTSKNVLDEDISPIAAKTLKWYREAQALIQEEMGVIAGSANEKGEVDPTGLPAKTEDLLKLYLNNQENWQSVCLVAEKNENDGSAVTYTLNRPMAFSLSENVAKMVLFGAMSNLITDGRVPISKTNLYSKFLRSFEKECAVYVGGPNKQDKPAVVIHGIQDLEGATEIASGTGVYMGGLEAAIDGVLDGRYKPLDFRFFIGCNSYQKGGLDAAIASNKYQPIACTRSLALKQCIQLPKPLWHEVMEMCGGELMEVSRLELQKRTDLNSE